MPLKGPMSPSRAGSAWTRTQRTNGDRLRSFLRDRARDRGGARRGGCERGDVRPAPRDARARSRAARRPCRPRRPDEPGRPPAPRRKTLKAFGGIDILVNNGGGPPRTSAEAIDDELLEGAVELLLVSAVRLTNLCLPELRRSGHGRVVNITSSSVREPIENLALSNAVRPGVVGWAKTLSREVGPDGITVNSIAPGPHRHRQARRGLPRRLEARGSERHPAPPLRPADARSPTSSASSPPTGRATSPAPWSPSTAASRAASSSERNRRAVSVS